MSISRGGRHLIIARGKTHPEDGEVKHAPIKLEDHKNLIAHGNGTKKERELIKRMIKEAERKIADIADRMVSEVMSSFMVIKIVERKWFS